MPQLVCHYPYLGDRGPYAYVLLLLRPRVGLAEAHKLSDVQRFFVVLSPESRKDAPRRMIAIGKKRMPDAATRERFFGFVQTTAPTVSTLVACKLLVLSLHASSMLGAAHFVLKAIRTVARAHTLVLPVPLQMEELTKGLGPQDYETKTQGSRHVEPARVLGEGALLHAHCLQPTVSWLAA